VSTDPVGDFPMQFPVARLSQPSGSNQSLLLSFLQKFFVSLLMNPEIRVAYHDWFSFLSL
jgi:hypothetical protein